MAIMINNKRYKEHDRKAEVWKKTKKEKVERRI